MSNTKIFEQLFNDFGKSPKLVIELEKVFTLDGRGRPAKCRLFLELIKEYGIDEVLKETEKIGNRKTF